MKIYNINLENKKIKSELVKTNNIANRGRFGLQQRKTTHRFNR